MPKQSPAADHGFDVTIDQILKAGGVNRRTFNRWMQLGLIERPRMVRVASGRGSRGIWGGWTIERVKRIRQLVADGMPLDKVLDALEIEVAAVQESRVAMADTIAKRWLEPGTAHADAAARLGQEIWQGASTADLVRGHVLLRALKVGVSGEQVEQIGRVFSEHAYLRLALELVLLGVNPVLLWDGSSAHVAADFMVSHLFGHALWREVRRKVLPNDTPDAASEPITPFGYVTINLWPVFLLLLDSDRQAGHIPSLPPSTAYPSYLPAPKVVLLDRADAPVLEYPYTVTWQGPRAAEASIALDVQAGQRAVNCSIGRVGPRPADEELGRVRVNVTRQRESGSKKSAKKRTKREAR